jgi:hypothetical protein
MVHNQYDLVHYRVRHISSNYFLASSFLAAGAGTAEAGLAGAVAVAVAAGLASAFFSAFLAGSAAKEVKANADKIVAINVFILFP